MPATVLIQPFASPIRPRMTRLIAYPACRVVPPVDRRTAMGVDVHATSGVAVIARASATKFAVAFVLSSPTVTRRSAIGRQNLRHRQRGVPLRRATHPGRNFTKGSRNPRNHYDFVVARNWSEAC